MTEDKKMEAEEGRGRKRREEMEKRDVASALGDKKTIRVRVNRALITC